MAPTATAADRCILRTRNIDNRESAPPSTCGCPAETSCSGCLRSEVAVTHLALGDYDGAFDWFDNAVDGRADCIPWLGVDPRLDPERRQINFTQQFAELLLRAGVEFLPEDPDGPCIRGTKEGIAEVEVT